MIRSQPQTVELPDHIGRALTVAFNAASVAFDHFDPNPKVGCVILDESGAVAGVGAHLGAGSDHAEIVALRTAGIRAAGGTAVVTLEPCNHQGLTGPCAQALIAAGVSEVYFAVSDPHIHGQSGDHPHLRGSDALTQAGVIVHPDVDVPRGRDFLRTWMFRAEHGRPFVTWKVASSIDGFIAPDAHTQVSLTGAATKAEVHMLRSQVGAVITGTGTIAVDDPQLTSRNEDGVPRGFQPRRVAVGQRDIPADASIVGTDGLFTHARTHEIGQVLAALASEGVHHVLLECGPGLAGAFLVGDYVDDIIWFVSPLPLGAGIAAAPGIHGVVEGGVPGWHVVAVDDCGQDRRLTLAPDRTHTDNCSVHASLL